MNTARDPQRVETGTLPVPRVFFRLFLLFLLAAAAALASGCAAERGQRICWLRPPPPPVDARPALAEAIARFEDADRRGWTPDRCVRVAEMFEAVARLGWRQLTARFNAGLVYQRCDLGDEAEAQYRAALAIDRHHAGSLVNLGQIHARRGDDAGARRLWERAIRADSRLAASRINLAGSLLAEIRARRGDPVVAELETRALRELQSALAIEADNARAYVMLAVLYTEGADRNRARMSVADLLLDRAEALDPELADLHNARGLVHVRREDPASAFAAFSKAVELDPDHVEARLNAGNIALDIRRYREALEHFWQAVRRRPDSYEANIGLGVAARAVGQLQAAEASYGRAWRLNPDRPEADFNLGVLYMSFVANETDDLSEARSAFETAIGHFREVTKRSAADTALRRRASAYIGLCTNALASLVQSPKSPGKHE